MPTKLPAQLNQVFLNHLVSAAQAIGETPDELQPRSLFHHQPVGQGTGLGLSLSYGIVRKHGGRICHQPAR